MIVGSISEEQDWGVCIVGTGPVGMALALEFDRLGDEVLVLEAGGSEIDPTTSLIPAVMLPWRLLSAAF